MKSRKPWVTVAKVLVGALLLAYALEIVIAIASNKVIQWEAIPKYLFSKSILNGVLVTIALAVMSQILGIVLGLIINSVRQGGGKILNALAELYIWVFRSTPILVLLIVIYNIGLVFPELRFGIPFTEIKVSASSNLLITSTVAAVIGLGVHESAYMAEIIRAGIKSIDPGQSEAAQVLGLTKAQALRKVILPQAVRVMLPPTSNQFVTMIKATSMVTVIAGADLLTSAQNIYVTTAQVVELLTVAVIWYLLLVSLATLGANALEKYVDRRFGHTVSTKRHGAVA